MNPTLFTHYLLIFILQQSKIKFRETLFISLTSRQYFSIESKTSFCQQIDKKPLER